MAMILLPQFVVRKIYEVTNGESIVVTGVGQNQMWAPSILVHKANKLVSSGGLGTMGFELPAALGPR